ncbi:ROK family protein, partial [Micromonospora carbonacea]|uniref:ROK family protein n=1 Tax=Micromonospora carbonacea TaxID=47853 RepID=UPI0033C22CA1
MKCALVRPDGTTVHTERHPTDAGRGPDAVVETILDVAEGLAGKARADGRDPVALGIAVPGVVDEAAGVAVWSANVGFRDVPLRGLAEERLGLPHPQLGALPLELGQPTLLLLRLTQHALDGAVEA